MTVRARPAVLLPAVLAAALAAVVPDAGAMVPGDVLTLRTCTVADLSPDGRWLLHAITAWDETAGAPRTTLFRRDLETGKDLLIFTPEDQSRAPAWRPDGRAVAYLRDTDAGAEIWLMDPDGSDRRRLDAGPGRRGALRWSPTGDALAWIAEAPVGEYPGTPGVRWVSDELGYRHLDGGERGGELGQLFVLDTAGGGVRRLVDAPLDVRACAWSPDGRRLVFAAKARADLGRNLDENLWVVDRAGGVPRRLTDNPGPDREPAWLPDGSIAYLRSADPLAESGPRAVAVLDPARGDGELLAEYGWDDMFWRWTAAGDAFWGLVARRGAIELARLGPGEPRVVTAAGLDFFSLHVAGGRAVLQGAGPTLPGGLFTVELDVSAAGPREAELIVDPNRAWRDRVGLVEPETFTATVEGRSVEAWVFKPPYLRPGEQAPAVLSLHGGPEWMVGGYFLPEFHILPHHGYAVIAPNPTGSTGYGFPFQEAIRGDWTGRPVRDVLACVDAAVAAGWADPERLAVMGGSFGGFLGAALTVQTDRFAAAALDRMFVDAPAFWGRTDEKWFPEWEFGGRPFDPEARETYRRNSPWERVDAVTTPTLISHGLRDWRCPVGDAEAWFAALRSRGVPARLIRFVDEGHGIRDPRNRAFYHEQLLEWFDTHVLGPSAEAGGHHD